jgi:cell division protein FtsW (lipid II flippase)
VTTTAKDRPVDRYARRNRRREAALLVVAWFLTVAALLLVQWSRSRILPPDTATIAALMAVLFASAHLAVRRLAPDANPVLLPIAGLLAGLGYALVTRLAPDRAPDQGVWITLGVVLFVVTLALLRDVRVLDRYRYTALVFGIGLLFLPLVPGIGYAVNGSQLWVRLGPVNFQPGEFAKILLVVFFASYLAENRELLAIPTRRIAGMGIPYARHFGPMLLAWGMSLVVLLLEKDLGSSLLVFSIFLAMLYAATARAAYVVIGTLLFSAGAYTAWTMFGHVQNRVDGWLDPLNPATVSGGTYQIAQSLFAFAEGSLWGTGLGRGRPGIIPEVATDFVFAAIGEELGFVGAMFVIVLYVLFVTAMLRVALRCTDPFGKLLVTGFAVTIGAQAFIIIGGVTGLIPLTGITLPFVSYGGSSILSNFVILAIVCAVSDQTLGGPRGHGLVRRKPMPVGSLLTGADS